MGTRNRQRRQDKKRRRQRAGAASTESRRAQPRPAVGARPGPTSSPPDADLVEALLGEAGIAFRARDRDAFGSLVAVLTADAARYEPDGADARWMAQLADIGAATWAADRPGLATWADREGAHPADAVGIAAELLSLLRHVPPLPRLVDPPGSGIGGSSARRPPPTGLDAKVLARVRALLAKAESTGFPEEAEALTAKAQQLIARHAIDRALLHTASPIEEVVGRRIEIDDPYAGAKAFLLGEVAEASRGRAVHGPALLPVLASRSQAVDDAFDRAFPGLSRRSLSASDRAGWVAGAVAAELASLSVGAELGAPVSA